ncbi:MAG TPA: hypothetical protein VKR42_01250 [Ktedonobacteraceae bacterium]|nr:hypothetical protein [Ktedonobacteraceae bacterium]
MQPANTQDIENIDQTKDETSAHHIRTLRIQRLVAALVTVAIGVLFLALPAYLTVGPNWLLLVLEGILLLPLLFLEYFNHLLSHRTTRLLMLAMLGVATAALASGIALLITSLPGNNNAPLLLRSAALLWCSNVLVFALWYWEIDGGGPLKRHLMRHKAVDFMFPQQTDGNTSNWMPHFLDYLFVAFTGATALSPADTYPLTRVAKGLMMIEAVFSMIVIVLLAARAVNIL